MKIPTFNEPDFLCVGCLGWGRGDSAKDAFENCYDNAYENYIKGDANKIYKIWAIADQIDEIQVDDFGGWHGKATEELDVTKPANKIVMEGTAKELKKQLVLDS